MTTGQGLDKAAPTLANRLAKLVYMGWPIRSMVRGELALQRSERRPTSVNPPKAPLARTRSGAEANSVRCGASALAGDAYRFDLASRRPYYDSGVDS